MTSVERIRYRLENPTPLILYVFDLIFDTLGYARQETQEDDWHVYYGRTPIDGDGIFIQQNDADLIWQDLLNQKISADILGKRIPFDIIYAIGQLITDEVNANQPADHYDTHGRLLFEQSFQAQHHLIHAPIVNMYINLLGEMITSQLGLTGLPLLPNGKRYAIGLSHDVDRLNKNHIWRTPLYLTQFSLKRNIFYTQRKVARMLANIRDGFADDFDLFTEVIDFEQRYGVSSTFFFAARNIFAPHGTTIDVFYDIEQPRIIELFGTIIEAGFEVGLHASYQAYTDKQHFVEEKSRLSQLAKTEVKGLRHHYWHMHPQVHPTLKLHAEAGFLYDTSIAFNNTLAFRRSVAVPYSPWDESEQKPMDILQLPVMCMDGNLFYENNTKEQAVSDLREMTHQLKTVGGVGIIDWHSDSSNPNNRAFTDWGWCYQQFVQEVAADSDAWVTNLSEITDWYLERKKQLR